MLRVVICVWIALLTALSLAPFAVKAELGTMGALHDIGHLSVFAATAVLLCWTATRLPQKLVRYLAVGALALTLEWLEAAVYHNPFEWRDVLIDVLGAAIGLAIQSFVPLISSRLADQ